MFPTKLSFSVQVMIRIKQLNLIILIRSCSGVRECERVGKKLFEKIISPHLSSRLDQCMTKSFNLAAKISSIMENADMTQHLWPRLKYLLDEVLVITCL